MAWLPSPLQRNQGQRAGLEAAAAKAKDRLGRLATMYADEVIDREGYEAGRDRALADLKAAEQALAELGAEAPEPIDWPALEEALRQAGGWSGALEQSDLGSQRDVLGLLIDTLTVERRRFGVYDVRITWSPLGRLLAKLPLAA